MKLSEIKPNPNNPRVLRDERFAKLKQSIEEFPKMLALRPMVVDNDGMILGGNMRYRVLQDLGYKEIPDEWVKRADELTEEEKRRFIITDNVGFGEWDFEALANDWDVDKLNDWGLELPGWKEEKLEAEEDDYEVTEVVHTDIVLGDLIEFECEDGRVHRLLCGDSTNADDVAKLMNGKKAKLMVTDPPYGVEYDPEWRLKAIKASIKGKGKLLNDDKADWKLAYQLFDADVAYVWHSALHTHQFAEDLIESGFDLICQIIWNKNTGALSRGDIHWKHEPCWYAVKKGKNHNWQGARNIWSVWDIQNLSAKSVADREIATGHATQKPIKCMSIPIENNSKEGDLITDPFLGGGTTLVASHQLLRICYSMELDEKHCQRVIDRMLKLDDTITVKINSKEYEKTTD